MTLQIKPAELYRDDVIELLTAQNLPVSDLPGVLSNFYVATQNAQIAGVAGLEIYGNYGLLRSVAVHANSRGRGIAAALLDKIEGLAAKKQLNALYLLTETAADYFEQKGYEHIARMDIPDAIKESSEFKQVCPDTATAMQKSI
ncbi:arsenic resistance N-acetyltransferase ArsN2 [Mucilaginibacter phyllosphaerae]|uniref:Amino-acid N-acetyltransferase n=1 Tax=Mucilaginibacter phyllosphaerae TaxID=1812349 RepID=A0A4Y8ACU0_9SPHI|nr:arsenic resistance N-acetyltransferase ArsN2 [Mucilaginibacter phyllosphaerae]MBB3969351.1 amino-acid N-acetyltransferase [Mucilaginibacter phyllosphaerae]TEW65859.1 GNAT family N-acetyltransferase [Mucilaginibacter phyllosphaerae]GGH07875.1 hypothetical protein GCM10007352_12810 [Mucilaginibacter phyllosphaerae]